MAFMNGNGIDGAPVWCKVVVMDEGGSEPNKEMRISVSLERADYEEICRVAKVKKVSRAWVIRDAIEKYLEADAPC